MHTSVSSLVGQQSLAGLVLAKRIRFFTPLYKAISDFPHDPGRRHSRNEICDSRFVKNE